MKAIVHIGTEKTGTSSIQSFLFKNRKALAAQGYHFLQSAGKTNNWALPAYCSEESRFDDFYVTQAQTLRLPLDNFKDEFIRKFEKEIGSVAKNIHTVIISSEHFHSRLRTDSEMKNIQQLLTRFFDQVRIVCYLREQAETCASWYSTSMKSGSTYSFYDFVRRCRPESYYFNYFDMLSNWETYFGRESMDVALFDRAHLLNRDLLDDFSARISPALVGKLDKSILVVNESLKPMGQALTRALNIAFPATNDEDSRANELRGRCKDVIAARLTGKGQQIALSRRELIYASFAESNEKLRKKYFPSLDVLFSPPVDRVVDVDEIDGDFLDVVNAVFNVLQDNGKSPLSPADNKRFWSAIITCVRDVIDIREGVMSGGVEVVLTEDDARLLRRAALRAEWADLPSAEKLMSLAQEVFPELPGARQQLQRYRDKIVAVQAGETGSEFMATFHGELKLDTPEAEAYMRADFAKWAASLEVPPGERIIWVSANSTRVSAGEVSPIQQPFLKAYTVFRARSFEEAVSIAERCPYVEAGGYLEVYKVEKLKL